MKYEYDHGGKKEHHFDLEYIHGSGIKAIKHRLHVDYVQRVIYRNAEWTLIYLQK